MGGVIVLGMTIGALTGGIFIRIGSRRASLINFWIGALGIGITMIKKFDTILVGRFIFGFSIGCSTTIVPKFIEETVPNHLYGSLVTCYIFSFNIGNLAANFWGLYLPKDKDKKALSNIFLFSIFNNLIFLCLYDFYYKT